MRTWTLTLTIIINSEGKNSPLAKGPLTKIYNTLIINSNNSNLLLQSHGLIKKYKNLIQHILLYHIMRRMFIYILTCLFFFFFNYKITLGYCNNHVCVCVCWADEASLMLNNQTISLSFLLSFSTHIRRVMLRYIVYL